MMHRILNQKNLLSILLALVLLTLFSKPIFAYGPNLIANPSVETASTNSATPQDWFHDNYGTNTTTYSYPVTGHESAQAVQIQISDYTNGDAKWYFQEVAVSPSTDYVYSDYYTSTVSTELTVRFTLASGQTSYSWLGLAPASSTWNQAQYPFTTPADAVSATVFHLIAQNGSLATDSFFLGLAATPTPTPTPTPATNNLIANPSVETTSASNPSLPESWFSSNYGSNITSFSYPVTGYDEAKAVQIETTSYTNGDAKWYFQEVPITAGKTYIYSDYYKSSIASEATARFTLSNSQQSYVWLGVKPASTDWQKAEWTFTAPANAVSMTIFRLIAGVGTLTTDKYSLTDENQTSTFAQGMISIDFDDGQMSSYTSGIPILNAAGLKSTQYIVPGYINTFDYVTTSAVLDMLAHGHEIQNHTMTHQNLTLLTPAQALNEITGATTFLNSLGASVTSIAFPYGAYNSSVTDTAKQAGLLSARTTVDGSNLKNTDPFALKSHVVDMSKDTVTSLEALIDKAVIDKTWLILLFHEVNNSGWGLAIKPNQFRTLTNYLVQHSIPVVTVSQGLAQMSQ